MYICKIERNLDAYISYTNVNNFKDFATGTNILK